MSSGNVPLPSRSEKNEQKTKKKHPVLKTVILLLVVLTLLGAGYLYFKYERMLDDVSGETEESVPKSQLAKSNPMTVLLLGLDSRPETGTMNTDVIMVVSLNPNRKTASVVSIPRDTYVQVEGYKARKANSFYSAVLRFEKENADTDKKSNAKDDIKKIFSEFLDIPIDYVSVINFKGFEQVIDQLGGVDVEVDMDMRYSDPTDGTNINLKKGNQTLNGKQALDFVRYRLGNKGGTPSSSDMQRNERQQQVIAAMIDKVGLFTILKLDGIFDAIGDNIETDIPKNQLKSFISTYMTISNEGIDYMPIEGSWKSPFIYLDPESFDKAKEGLNAQLK
jgi:LCP family protein required for cell wall assembly